MAKRQFDVCIPDPCDSYTVATYGKFVDAATVTIGGKTLFYCGYDSGTGNELYVTAEHFQQAQARSALAEGDFGDWILKKEQK